MANRQLFHSFQEILSEDMNNFRNSIEKTLFELFLGRALPSIPSFISSSMNPSVSGNIVTINAGIGFQNIPQTDGSTNIRVISLESSHEIEFTDLPTGNNTRVDLIQIRSQIEENLPEERSFNVAGAIQQRDTVTTNKWSSEINIRRGVTPDANGEYSASLGVCSDCCG